MPVKDYWRWAFHHAWTETWDLFDTNVTSLIFLFALGVIATVTTMRVAVEITPEPMPDRVMSLISPTVLVAFGAFLLLFALSFLVHAPARLYGEMQVSKETLKPKLSLHIGLGRPFVHIESVGGGVLRLFRIGVRNDSAVYVKSVRLVQVLPDSAPWCPEQAFTVIDFNVNERDVAAFQIGYFDAILENVDVGGRRVWCADYASGKRLIPVGEYDLTVRAEALDAAPVSGVYKISMDANGDLLLSGAPSLVSG